MYLQMVSGLVAHYPLNRAYGVLEASANQLTGGVAMGTTFAGGPNGKYSGSFFLHGDKSSFIEFSVITPKDLDTRYSLAVAM